VEQLIQSTAVRRAIPFLVLLVSGVMVYQAVRLWIADAQIHADSVETIAKGAQLEPGNAAAWDTLGRYQQLDFINSDPAQALESYKHAVRDDPRSAPFHMNLAAAYEADGDIPHAREQFEKAREVYPLSAEVAWNYGNFLLRQDQPSEGYSQIQRAVQIDPSLLTLGVSRTWRSSHDVHILLDQVLPRQPEAYFQALDFFVSIHQTEPALVVWQRLTALGQLITLSRAFPLLDELIAQDQSTDAHRVWIEALAAAGLPHDEPVNHSAIWNGLFTTDFENGGLGWRYDLAFGVSIEFDSAPAGLDGRSVRLDFGGGSNPEILQPMQYVPVQPSRLYHFSASIRTEGISTESGVRFSIRDPNHPEVPVVETENLTGSHPWSFATADISTGPQTHFVVVRLHRAPSRLFENKLSGSVWIANVSMSMAENKPGSSNE
jgi:tetratricopeptide (TPR) repeat protein